MKTKSPTRISIRHVRTHLSALIRRVEAGEEITILRHGEAVARLVASREKRAGKRPLGLLHGQWQLPPAADLIKPDDDLESLFYGEDG